MTTKNVLFLFEILVINFMSVLFSTNLINQYIRYVMGGLCRYFIINVCSTFQELYINVLDMSIIAFIRNRIIIFAFFTIFSYIYFFWDIISSHLSPLLYTYTSLCELIWHYVYVWTTLDNIKNPNHFKIIYIENICDFLCGEAINAYRIPFTCFFARTIEYHFLHLGSPTTCFNYSHKIFLSQGNAILLHTNNMPYQVTEICEISQYSVNVPFVSHIPENWKYVYKAVFAYIINMIVHLNI